MYNEFFSVSFKQIIGELRERERERERLDSHNIIFKNL